MADTITLPGLGPTKKTTAYLLGGILVLVAGVAWYRSKKQAAAPASTPSSGDGSGQPQDGSGTGGGPYDGSGYGGYGGSSWYTPPTQPTGYTTNAAWAQAVEDYLVNTVHGGNNADVIGAALGKYLTGQPLSSDQVVIVEQAIAFGNYPPVNGPSGHPPAYFTASSGGSGGGSGGGSSLGAPGAPTVSAIDKHGASLHWSSVPHASHYVIFYKMNGQSQVHQAGTTGGPSFRIGYFSPGTRLTVWVNAVDSSGKRGPSSSATSFATHH